MKGDRDLRFLVVDDMANMRRTIRNMLRKIGYEQVLEADDGDSAYRALKSARVDFVICDWNMPRMRGIDLLRKVREDESFQNLPFLLVTGEVEEATIVQAAEEEVDGYIIKPFVASTLEERINAILHRRANPTDLERHLRVARALLASGAHKEALAEVDQALRIRPNSARSLELKGQILEADRRLREAEEAYRGAVERNSLYIPVQDRLAALLTKMGQKEKAAQCLEAAAKISPRNAARQAALGQALLDAGRLEEAEGAFVKSIELDPEGAEERRTQLGEIYLERGMDQKAAETFQKVLDENPRNIHVYNRLGIAYRRQRLYKAAIEEYRKAIAIDPNDEVLHYNLGRAHMENGDLLNAKRAFQKSLELDPAFEEAREMLKSLEGKV